MTKTTLKVTVSKLDHEVRCGDWHDRPLKWQTTTNTGERQLAATKKEALLYARIRRMSVNEAHAINAYVATA